MTDVDAAIRAALKSQYHAALAMLGEAIRECPQDLWDSQEPLNAYWQVAYHALFFTHLYLQVDEAAFRPWEVHQGNCQHPDGLVGRIDPDSDLPVLPDPYTKEEVLAYWELCDGMVDGAVDTMDIFSAESGFHWYPIPKLDHQLVNIRHIQHHAGQLADRLRTATRHGVAWAGKGAS